MKVRSSALKHHITAIDEVRAASWAVMEFALDEENPRRFLRLGFDTKSRLLELVVLVDDDGTEELIHAMKARRQYIDLLP